MRPTLSTVLLAALSVPAAAQQANFNVYVALGDSLTAGVQSGGLVQTHQVLSYPAQIAHQAGVQGFEQPLVSEPGIPPLLTLQALVPIPTLVPASATPGAPVNLGLARPYNNLGVPGAISVDLVTRVTDGGGAHDLILRGRGTALQQATGLRPTFVTLWIGNNDVLGAAVRGRAIPGVTLTPTAAFRQAYATAIAALKASGATVVAANVPDVTSIPYVTTIKPYVTNPITGEPVLVAGQRVPLLGPNGPLPSSSYVLLPASTLLARGVGIPAPLGTGQPLPDELVLDPTEAQLIQDFTNTNNQAIAELCAAAAVPVVDANGIFRDIVRNGRNVGGVVLTAGFLTGGIFSYDGVHPNDIGYGIVSNEFIKVINEKAGGTLPYVALAPLMGLQAAGVAHRPLPFEFTEEAYLTLLESFPTVEQR